MSEIFDDDMVIQLRQLFAGSGQSFIGLLQINVKAVLGYRKQLQNIRRSKNIAILPCSKP